VHPRSHQPIPGPCPHAQRSRSPKADDEGTEIMGSDEGPAVPGEPQPHRPGVTPGPGSQLQSTFGREVVSASGYGTDTGCRGRAFWDCTRLTTSCLEKEPKAGKGLDSSWRNK